MTVIQSLGSLADLQPEWMPRGSYGSLSLYAGYTADYATMYRTQPNVRVCVDFIARNIAQLGLHVFRRVDEQDRVRLRDHGLARLITRPNAFTTRYRLLSETVTDLGIYGRAYWLKLRSRGELALLRLPPAWVSVRGAMVPAEYRMQVSGREWKFPPEDIVHFRWPNPESTLDGLSALESLRRLLAEEEAAGDYREYFWMNKARMGGFLMRPADAPAWGQDTRNRFLTEFGALYDGSENSGKTALLEDGMTWMDGTFSARDSQLDESRKLNREEVARAYHIPLPMVGILDHATFSNIREQHKNLYQDSLGPPLVAMEEEIELQLMPEFGDVANVYVEFNIMEKLKGSFEEQMSAFQASVGRPFVTPDEARGRLNLPSMGGQAAELGVPVNMVVGELNAPETGQEVQSLARRTLDRQRSALAKRIAAGLGVDDAWDAERWDRELTADLAQLGVSHPQTMAQQMNAAHLAQLAAEMEVTHAGVA